VPKAGIALSAEQVARVKTAFSKPTGDQGHAACFFPRHGLVFEDAEAASSEHSMSASNAITRPMRRVTGSWQSRCAIAMTK
jgi:hypothetical protein